MAMVPGGRSGLRTHEEERGLPPPFGHASLRAPRQRAIWLNMRRKQARYLNLCSAILDPSQPRTTVG
jgi:hypothetical protein